MRQLGMQGIVRGRPVRTTIPSKDGKRAGDLLNRNFHTYAPNKVWVTDFTYVRTWAGFVYVALVIDLYARRIVGWSAMQPVREITCPTPLTGSRSSADFGPKQPNSRSQARCKITLAPSSRNNGHQSR